MDKIINEIDGVLNTLNAIRFELSEMRTMKMRYEVKRTETGKEPIPIGPMGDAEWEHYMRGHSDAR